MKKKLAALALLSVMSVSALFGLTACGGDTGARGSNKLTIAMFQGGRGRAFMDALVAEFQKTFVGVVEIVSSPTIEDELPRMINDGNFPDLVFLATGKPKSVTEGLIKDRKLEDLTPLLSEAVTGEDTALGDKLVENILASPATNPYADGKTYLLPYFYSPTGLFYDANKFGPDKAAPFNRVPETWDEFFALGDALYAQRRTDPAVPYLFTYPTAGYFDSVLYPTVAAVAGMDKYQKMIRYEDGIWQDADVVAALGKIAKLGEKDASGAYKYLEPNTVGQANQESFVKNQQAVIGNGKTYDPASATALFMPNGDWLPGEMKLTTPEGFTWGFAPIPKKDGGSQQYINTFVEQIFVHSQAPNKQAAKNFIKLMFSDRGAEITAKAEGLGAVIPTKSALANAEKNGVPEAIRTLYDVYAYVQPVTGAFVATEPVPDVVWQDILLARSVDEVMKGNLSLEQWAANLESASDKLRARIINP